ncbi:MAG: ATP-binding protein [Microthrixaceae bacterium]
MNSGGVVVAALLAVVSGVLGVLLVRTRRQLVVARRSTTQRAGELEALVDPEPSELRRVVNALPVATVIVDASGTVRVSNRAGEEVLEPRIESALVGRAVRSSLAEAATGRRVRHIEELFGPPLERHIITAVPLEGGGAVAVVQDDSDVARTEAVRRDFVANISHELKTPVGAVTLLAEMLADETDPATAKRFAASIEAEVGRLGRSVDDLLELTQIEFGLPDGSADVPLDDVIEEVRSRLLSVAAERSISLEVPAEPTRLVVRGDRRQLGSALFNLVDNAVKYSDDGGTVRIELRRSPDAIAVEVSDSGIGIPGTDLERIFERFYRVDRARGRDTGGTGLGLAIVRHVVHNHGGSVEAASTEGVGSTFVMKLPAAQEAHP